MGAQKGASAQARAGRGPDRQGCRGARDGDTGGHRDDRPVPFPCRTRLQHEFLLREGVTLPGGRPPSCAGDDRDMIVERASVQGAFDGGVGHVADAVVGRASSPPQPACHPVGEPGGDSLSGFVVDTVAQRRILIGLALEEALYVEDAGNGARSGGVESQQDARPVDRKTIGRCPDSSPAARGRHVDLELPREGRPNGDRPIVFQAPWKQRSLTDDRRDHQGTVVDRVVAETRPRRNGELGQLPFHPFEQPDRQDLVRRRAEVVSHDGSRRTNQTIDVDAEHAGMPGLIPQSERPFEVPGEELLLRRVVRPDSSGALVESSRRRLSAVEVSDRQSTA